MIDESEKNESSLFDVSAYETQVDLEEKDEPASGDLLAELSGGALKQFPQDFSEGHATGGAQLKLPDADLYLEQTNVGGYILKTDEGDFFKVRNPTEANFIIYAQMRGHQQISLPKEMIHVFKTVKGYENYVRGLEGRLMNSLTKKAKQRSVAEYEAKKRCQEHGLPWLLE
jgi:hypothetical protein